MNDLVSMSANRRDKTRVRWGIAVLAISSLLLPMPLLAQTHDAAGWAKIVAAAKREGRVSYYSAANPAPLARIVDGFKKAYPDIAVDFQRIPSGPLLTKLDQERGSGAEGADVANATEINWFVARGKEGKLLRPIGPATREWPAKYLLDGSVVIAGMEPLIVSWNTARVPNAPKSYADLLRPEFKGRLGLSELASVAVVAWYDWVEKSQGGGYVAKLRAQNPKLYVGSVPIAQAVASGEISVGGFGTPTSVKPLKDSGAPIDYFVPSPGLGIRYALAGFSWGKNPNAALVLLDYIMSRDGQTAWHSNGETASPLNGIAGALSAASIDPFDPNLYPPEVERKFRDDWNKAFK